MNVELEHNGAVAVAAGLRKISVEIVGAWLGGAVIWDGEPVVLVGLVLADVRLQSVKCRWQDGENQGDG